jgi:hypothetical protein
MQLRTIDKAYQGQRRKPTNTSNKNPEIMTDNQENRMNMFYATQKFLAANASIYVALPAFVAAAAELDANIDALESATEKQVINIKGFAADKAKSEAMMIAATLSVAGGTRAYATVIGDLILAGKMEVTPTSLIRHRDSVIAQHCQGIHLEANAVVANLADYGVTPAVLADLQTAIDTYVLAIAAPRAAITERKGATAEIRTLLKDTNKLLTKRLDALVTQFTLSKAEFVRGYFDARIIVNNNSFGENKEPVPVAA